MNNEEQKYSVVQRKSI